jgi:hypothetical protein
MNMDIYLTIMVTVLVATQVIRVTQNAIQLHRQEKAVAKDIAWIKDNDISQRDFDVQRDCFYLLRDYLEREMNINYGEEAEDYYEGSEDG